MATDEALNTSLLHAARRGDPDEVTSLIAKGADANTQNEDGTTPLHAAAYAAVSRPSPTSRTVTPVIDALILSGANVNLRDVAGHTPLHTAVWNHHPDTVAIIYALIAAGANFEMRDNNELTALDHAVQLEANDKIQAIASAQRQSNPAEWARKQLILMRLPGRLTNPCRML